MAVCHRHRLDRLADQDGAVGGQYRIGRGHGEFELTRGVLRVELLDRYPLGVERGQQVVEVAGQLDHPGHPVRRPGARRRTVGRAEEPLDLERHPQPQPAIGGGADRTPGEGALAAGVGRAVLGPPVRRRPSF